MVQVLGQSHTKHHAIWQEQKKVYHNHNAVYWTLMKLLGLLSDIIMLNNTFSPLHPHYFIISKTTLPKTNQFANVLFRQLTSQRVVTLMSSGGDRRLSESIPIVFDGTRNMARSLDRWMGRQR